MAEYSKSYIAFAKQCMATQGDEIKQWVNSDNPLVASLSKEIIEVSKLT